MGKVLKKIFKGIRSVISKVLITLLVLVVLSGTVFGIWFYKTYGKYLLKLQGNAKAIAKNISDEDFRASQTSLVYSDDGTLITTLSAEKDVYYLEYEDIPQTVKDTVIVTEDRKFFEHTGVDIYANIRASIVLIKNKGKIYQGGSTITQQLTRNIYLTNEVTLERKITEIFLASEIEKIYSKEKILEFYLNNIYYANGHYGIQAAAYGYFGRSINSLNISEMVFLCAIPNNPTLYDPLVNFKAAVGHRDKCLVQLYEHGYISEEEYNEALAYEIELAPFEAGHNNYVESFTYYCAVRAMMQKDGFEIRNYFMDSADREQYYEEYYELYNMYMNDLYTGGYRIYTSIDLEKQDMLMKAVSDNLSEFEEVSDEGIYEVQGAAVCIDNESGNVIAIAGGRSQELTGYTLNRGYQAYRQPGSAIKPLVVYTPWFERGMYPDDIVADARFEGGPKNSGGVYSGDITVRYAVEVSKNTVAWKLFEELTPQTGIAYLLNMGFSKIVSSDYVPAASLGGMTYGTSPLEMAAAYATLENDGIYRTPDCIVKITDSDGNTIVEDNESNEKRVYGENAALIMKDVLKGVMTGGTGRKLNLPDFTCAGKTGTTMNGRDGWFCGFTHYYTTAVWVGADMPREIENLSGNTYPGYIWHDYMEMLHEGLDDVYFGGYVDNRPPAEAPEDETGQSEENTEPVEDKVGEGEESTEPAEEETVTGENGENTEPAEGEIGEGEENTEPAEEEIGAGQAGGNTEPVEEETGAGEFGENTASSEDGQTGETSDNVQEDVFLENAESEDTVSENTGSVAEKEYEYDENQYYEPWWYEEGWDEYYKNKSKENVD